MKPIGIGYIAGQCSEAEYAWGLSLLSRPAVRALHGRLPRPISRFCLTRCGDVGIGMVPA